MATVKNHKITATVRKTIAYALNDKKESLYDMRSSIRDSIAYATDDKTGTVTYYTLKSTQNCNPSDPIRTFDDLTRRYGSRELQHGNPQTKTGAPVLAWHYHQSFEGHVDPATANEIGQKFAAEMFPDFPAVIGTHTNTENTHNHIVVCAWNLSGKKWNQCNAAYQRAREVSDRLCDEYGLGVLEPTRQQRLVRWYDKDGRIHFYEPTPRKDEMIRQRNAGEISPDRAGSYRNTFSYDENENRKLTNREIIRRDINRLLPAATSFEHLLRMLRDTGYRISDKKKDGSWLKYISYRPPTAEKGTRDYKLSEDGYYLRTNLEKVIRDHAAERENTNPERDDPDTDPGLPPEKDIPFFEEYIYGKTDLSSIDNNYRAVRQKDGSPAVVPRSSAEKRILHDIRKNDAELRSLIDTAKLKKLVLEQQYAGQKEGSLPKKREEILVRQIQESFHTLRFMEKENLYSQSQINRVTETTWKQYNECLSLVNRLEKTVLRLEQILKTPAAAKSIEERIRRMSGSGEYRAYELETDSAQLGRCRAVITKFKLEDPDSIKALSEKAAEAKDKISHLCRVMETQQLRLAEFERCTRTLERSEKRFGRGHGEAMQEYRSISDSGKEKARKDEAERRKRRDALR